MKNIHIASVAIMILYHAIMVATSQQSSELVHGKQRINFKGTLFDMHNQTFKVDNISIAGMYKDIAVYTEPEDPKINPTIDTTRLDLAEITQIEPTTVPPQEGVVTYDKRTYIKITVTLKDKAQTRNNFIIETSRKIMCDIINDAGPIEKEISFEALKKLVIEDHSLREPSEKQDQKDKERKEYLCAQAGSSIRELEKETEQLKTGEKGKIGQLVETVKNWIGGICGS